jgi:hypothetical protein
MQIECFGQEIFTEMQLAQTLARGDAAARVSLPTSPVDMGSAPELPNK